MRDKMKAKFLIGFVTAFYLFTIQLIFVRDKFLWKLLEYQRSFVRSLACIQKFYFKPFLSRTLGAADSTKQKSG
jgi:hypothetical protein